MRKKYFLYFLLSFFLQFSFWPALGGLNWVPPFVLAFLVVLSGKISFKESFFWFFFGGILLSYFSPWPVLLELITFSFLVGMLFLLEKIFLWQRKSFWLESFLLFLSKIFFDGLRFFLLKLFYCLGIIEIGIEGQFVFFEYLIELVIFIVVGLIIFFLFFKDRNLAGRNEFGYHF